MVDTLGQVGRLLYASHNGFHLLRFVGEIRHPMSPSLERFLDRLLTEKAKGLVIDLVETQIIDSTCLGLLARTALRLRSLGLEKATVVSPHPHIAEVLRSMSFDRLFNIVGEMVVGKVEERALKTPDESGEDALLDIMLGAHRTLMSLSAQNRLQFKDVVEALERESEAHREEAEWG